MPISLEQIIEIFEREKPHLIRIEDEVEDVGYGDITIELRVRAGRVERMEFVRKAKTWLRDTRKG